MPKNPFCILALDGRDPYILSQLRLLGKLMNMVNPAAPPKPCDCFDMIAGSGTNGLVAGMLARSAMSVEECLEAYQLFAEKKPVRIQNSESRRDTILFSDVGLLKAATAEVLKKREGHNDRDNGPESEKAEDVKTEPTGHDCEHLLYVRERRTDKWVCISNTECGKLLSWDSFCNAAGDFEESIAEKAVSDVLSGDDFLAELGGDAKGKAGSDSFVDIVQCFVSIGAGVPENAIGRDQLAASQDVQALTLGPPDHELELAEEKTVLTKSERYYRFAINDILQNAKPEEFEHDEDNHTIIPDHLDPPTLGEQLTVCADNLSRRRYIGKYRVPLNLRGAPTFTYFVDRPVPMKKLEDILIAPKKGDSRRSRLAIHGNGGAGKTHLAMEFVQRHQEGFSAVFWLDGTTRAAFRQSLAACASLIPQGQISERSRLYSQSGSIKGQSAVISDVVDWLSREDNTRWLLVVDNVGSNIELERLKALEETDGSILVITREEKVENIGFPHASLAGVSTDEAKVIFAKWNDKLYNPADLDQLLSRLDGLPLTIIQTAACLREIDLLPSEFAPNEDSERLGWLAWVTCYDTVQAQNPAAASLILLWAHLEDADLWFGLLEAAYKENELLSDWMSEWLGDIPADEAAFQEAIRLLRSFALVGGLHESNGYQLDKICRERALSIQSVEERDVLEYLAAAIVGTSVSVLSTAEDPLTSRRMVTLANSCGGTNGPLLNAIRRKAVDLGRLNLESERADILIGGLEDFAYHMCEQGKLDESLALYEEIFKSMEKKYGFDNPAAFESFYNIGHIHSSLGNLDKAADIYEKVLEERKKFLGPRHHSTMILMNDLGVIYKEKGELDQAIRMHEQTANLRSVELGPEHPSTLLTLNNLAVEYECKNRLDDAQRIYERVLEAQERVIGPDAPATLSTRLNLGSLCRMQKKMEEAERLGKHVVEVRINLLGPEHGATLNAMHTLAIIYDDQGRTAEARELFTRCLKGLERLHYPGHPDLLLALHNFGAFCFGQGEIDRAEELFLQSLDAWVKCHPEHPRVLAAFHNLAVIAWSKGRLDQAEEYFFKAAHGRESVLGIEHPLTTDSFHALEAVIAENKGQAEPKKLFILSKL